MALAMSTGCKHLALDAIGDELDDYVLDLYDGSRPSSPNDAEAGTLLGSVALDSDAFAAAASGTIAANAVPLTGAGVANGTATWGRIRRSDDAGGSSTTAVRIDGSVGSDILVANASITNGQPIVVTAISFGLTP